MIEEDLQRLMFDTRALVLEWAADHREELRENWLLAEQHEPLNDIDPLE
jgi:hypothetical protein